MKKYRLAFSCVSAPDVEKLREMIDDARDITRRTFLTHVPRHELARVFESYGFERGYVPPDGDCFVHYQRSRYDGRRCYFFTWSSIEFVYLPGSESYDDEIQERVPRGRVWA
jgi:hypothetical protein